MAIRVTLAGVLAVYEVIAALKPGETATVGPSLYFSDNALRVASVEAALATAAAEQR